MNGPFDRLGWIFIGSAVVVTCLVEEEHAAGSDHEGRREQAQERLHNPTQDRTTTQGVSAGVAVLAPPVTMCPE